MVQLRCPQVRGVILTWLHRGQQDISQRIDGTYRRVEGQLYVGIVPVREGGASEDGNVGIRGVCHVVVLDGQPQPQSLDTASPSPCHPE